MCSTPARSVSEIGKAIEDLAAEALAAYAPNAERPTRSTRRPLPDLQPEPSPTGPNSANLCQADDSADLSDAGSDQLIEADQVADADQVVVRLAQLWARLAELDPEVARRMPRYQA